MAPAAHIHRLVATPVDDGRRHRGGGEQAFDLAVDVILVNAGVPGLAAGRQHDLLALHDGVQVIGRQPPVAGIGHVHAGNGGGQGVQACAAASHRLLGDLGNRVGWRKRLPGISQRVVFLKRMPWIGVQRIHRAGGHHQTGPGAAAVRHQQCRALGVDLQGVVVILPGQLKHREMQHVVEVPRQVPEIAAGKVNTAGYHARLLAAFTGAGRAEAGNRPDLVVGSEELSQGESDLAGGPGQEDFLVLEHGTSFSGRSLLPWSLAGIARTSRRDAAMIAALLLLWSF